MDYLILFFEKYCGKYVYNTDKIAAFNHGCVTRLTNGRYFNQEYVDKVMAVLVQDQNWKAAQKEVPSSETAN